MKSQTELSENFELPEDRDFRHQVIFHLATQTLLGFIIASFLIMGVLTFVDWIKR